MGTHYEHAVGVKKKVPIAMAFRHPNTAKSTALECALSVLGRGEMPLGDTTHAQLIKELSSHSLPLMWDDVSNLSQLENIAITRIFSRTLIVPFKEVEVKDSLIDRLKLKEKLDQRMANSIKSCGVILGLVDISMGCWMIHLQQKSRVYYLMTWIFDLRRII